MQPHYTLMEDTPVGRVLAVLEDGELLAIRLNLPADDLTGMLEKIAPLAEPGGEEAGALEKALRAYFTGEDRRAIARWPVSRKALGGAFRREVYEALRQVPAGSTVSYGELAARVGRPKAARAVGRAMATNQVPIAIPCHRVLAANGALGGFTGGLHLKRALLALEGVPTKG